MAFFTAGFGLLLHFLFWGAGLALLITPRRWQAGWPALCAPAGIALQSAVVWFGALSGVQGAQVYGKWSVALPALLLAAGLWRALADKRRSVWREITRWQGVGFMMVVVLNVLLIPFAVASKVLTSSSLGSCDAADYSAGARVLLEFAKTDRSGFMGLTEVVELHSVDNFFDHWIRLNHFTPSALVALNAAVFSLQPYELISVMTAVFVTLSLPTVYWLARSTFYYQTWASGWVTAVYGLSPLVWYAVYHVAMSQLLAALAIALLTGGAIAVWREGASWRAGLAWAGVLLVAYWIIMGAYNFIVIVSLVPAVAYAGGQTLWRNDWLRFGRWLILILAPLVIIAAVFTQRTLGLMERFILFQQYDFGWKIPALTPEGWLGMVGSTSLGALPVVARWMFGLLFVGLLVVAVVRATRVGRVSALLACAVTLPILGGYLFLQVRGRVHGTNASYDAYKLMCVFYPGLLAGLAYWLTWGGSASRWVRAFIVLCALTVLGFNGYAAHRFTQRMQSPPLLVDRPLAQLQRLETVPEVTSINLLIGDFWARLWANSFLLRKKQYFPTHTYEGRRNTALKGEWDLLGGVISVRLPNQKEELQLSPPYSLLNTSDPLFLRVKTGEGWYDQEVIARVGARWRWTKGDASLFVENLHSVPLRASLRCSLRSLVDRDLQVWVNGKMMRSANVGTQLRMIRIPPIELPPGTSLIELKSSTPPTSLGPRDARKLGFAAYGIEINVRPEADRWDP